MQDSIKEGAVNPACRSAAGARSRRARLIHRATITRMWNVRILNFRRRSAWSASHACVASFVAAGVLGACGGSPASTSTPHTISASASTVFEITTTSPPTTVVAASPNATLKGRTPDGDEIEATLTIGEPKRLGDSDVPQAGLRKCFAQDMMDTGRAMYVKVYATIVLKSALQTDLAIDFHQEGVVFVSSEGSSCGSEGISGVRWGSVEPGGGRAVTMWIQLGNVISPAFPSGDPAAMGDVPVRLRVGIGKMDRSLDYTSATLVGDHVYNCSSWDRGVFDGLPVGKVIAIIAPRPQAGCVRA